MQNFKFIGATVSEFRFQREEKKMVKDNNNNNDNNNKQEEEKKKNNNNNKRGQFVKSYFTHRVIFSSNIFASSYFFICSPP